jgi:hypothetical protein
MSDGTYPLDTIQVASPCDASWEAMSGDEWARFCPQCRQRVYNLSALSRREAEDLLQRREGRLCVRLYRRADGTVLTNDCPVGLRALRRRMALVGGAAAALLLGLIGWSAGVARSERGNPGGASRSHLPPPWQAILDWIDPVPYQSVTMGAPCPPPRPAPPPGKGEPAVVDEQKALRPPDARKAKGQD